jgi:O-antigen/teichoic acid export membrane protein
MPTAVSWQKVHGPTGLFRRLWGVAFALAAAAGIYFALLWFARSFLFAQVLHKHFAQRDSLLLAWSAVFLTMVFRDQLQYLPAANGQFRASTVVTAIAACVSLTCGYLAISHLGVLGAPIGVLVGELANVAGILVLCVRQIRSAAVTSGRSSPA